MFRIKGVELNEVDDLSYNIEKVRSALVEKTSFWTAYKNTVKRYRQNHSGRAGVIFRVVLFISLLPRLGSFIFWRGNLANLMAEAEDEIRSFYEKPLTKVRRFRLKCSDSKRLYANEIDLIDQEIDLQEGNLKFPSIGDQTKNEIMALLGEFKNRKSRKLSKYNFYLKCEEKLLSIEEQIKVKQSIEQSRLKLEQFNEIGNEVLSQDKVQEEFELYSYYGDLLDSISLSMKRLEQDEEEKIEEEVMIKMLDDFESNQI